MLSEIFVLPLTFLLIILSQYARFLWIYASWRQWIHETTQNWEYSCSYLKVNAWNSILWLIPQKVSYIPNTTETTQILEYSYSNCTQSPTTQTTKSCDWLLFSIFLHRVLYGDNVYKVRLKLILISMQRYNADGSWFNSFNFHGLIQRKNLSLAW